MVRLKARYVLFDVIYPPTLTSANNPLPAPQARLQLHQTSPQITHKLIAETVKHNIKLLFGTQGEGLAALALVVKYFSGKTSTGIIRCAREHFRLVVAALTVINTLGDKKVIVRVLRISGTIKKSENFAVDRNRRMMRQMNLKEEEVNDGMASISDDDEEDD